LDVRSFHPTRSNQSIKFFSFTFSLLSLCTKLIHVTRNINPKSEVGSAVVGGKSSFPEIDFSFPSRYIHGKTKMVEKSFLDVSRGKRL
jgi:hypothetical protein